jgi:hypothetical protein
MPYSCAAMQRDAHWPVLHDCVASHCSHCSRCSTCSTRQHNQGSIHCMSLAHPAADLPAGAYTTTLKTSQQPPTQACMHACTHTCPHARKHTQPHMPHPVCRQQTHEDSITIATRHTILGSFLQSNTPKSHRNYSNASPGMPADTNSSPADDECRSTAAADGGCSAATPAAASSA